MGRRPPVTRGARAGKNWRPALADQGRPALQATEAGREARATAAGEAPHGRSHRAGVPGGRGGGCIAVCHGQVRRGALLCGRPAPSPVHLRQGTSRSSNVVVTGSLFAERCVGSVVAQCAQGPPPTNRWAVQHAPLIRNAVVVMCCGVSMALYEEKPWIMQQTAECMGKPVEMLTRKSPCTGAHQRGVLARPPARDPVATLPDGARRPALQSRRIGSRTRSSTSRPRGSRART